MKNKINIEHPTSNTELRNDGVRAVLDFMRKKAGWGIFAVLFVVQTASAQEMLGEYKWKDAGNLPKGAVLTTVDGREVLKIENTNSTPLQVNLLTITNPKVTAMVYGISGELKYEAVEGQGYIELWNYFPSDKPGQPEAQYFSRTLAENGLTEAIQGTSGWRGLWLPFDRTGASQPPTRLQVNLVLRGHGTVWLGPIKLMQLPKVKSAASLLHPNAWWSGRTAGASFGSAGAIVGCLGGLCGWLAARGKARRFVVGTLWLFMALGTSSALIGFIALAIGQPFFVWSPLLFMALILLAIAPVNLRQFRRQYEELELRRMASLDASRA